MFGATGEVCRPHGAGPGEGVLASERHPVPRYLHHGVPSKVALISTSIFIVAVFFMLEIF